MSKNKHLKKADPNSATQSNKLIEATYKMSVPAKRVMLMLLGQIHPGQQDISKKITIEASDYSEKTGISLNQSYVDIKNGCKELMKTIITTRNQKEKSTEHCVVINWMKYHDSEGWLEATFTPWIAPYIHSLARLGYTTITVDEALKFKRFYTIRLYELLMQFKKTRERYIKLDSLRTIFQIEKNKYPKFAAFRTWVLEPSIEEINEKTNWDIDWEPIKTGKKVTSISFIFEERNPVQPPGRCPHTIDMLQEAEI
jgi:plasmid replication initiation protein